MPIIIKLFYSCPKRDKDKEEKDKDSMPKKRKAENQFHGKKPAKLVNIFSEIKQESVKSPSPEIEVDNRRYSLMGFPNKRTQISVLRHALGEVVQQLDELSEDDLKGREELQTFKNKYKEELGKHLLYVLPYEFSHFIMFITIFKSQIYYMCISDNLRMTGESD